MPALPTRVLGNLEGEKRKLQYGTFCLKNLFKMPLQNNTTNKNPTNTGLTTRSAARRECRTRCPRRRSRRCRRAGGRRRRSDRSWGRGSPGSWPGGPWNDTRFDICNVRQFVKKFQSLKHSIFTWFGSKNYERFSKTFYVVLALSKVHYIVHVFSLHCEITHIFNSLLYFLFKKIHLTMKSKEAMASELSSDSYPSSTSMFSAVMVITVFSPLQAPGRIWGIKDIWVVAILAFSC